MQAMDDGCHYFISAGNQKPHLVVSTMNVIVVLPYNFRFSIVYKMSSYPPAYSSHFLMLRKSETGLDKAHFKEETKVL